MRLFIAINFDDSFKTGLLNIIKTLKRSGIKGNFTAPDNLHLTLVFLGEIEYLKLSSVKAAMDSAVDNMFKLKAVKVGSFKGKEAKCRVYFADIYKNQALNELQSNLNNALREREFILEERAFKPHITLAREIPHPDLATEEDILKLLPLTQNVESIELMESVNIDGRIRYKAIHTVRLFSQ